MLTKTTIIGICIGAVILGIGIASMILNSPFLHTESRDATIGVEKMATYEFTAPKSSHQRFTVTGDDFHIKLTTPGDGIQKDEDFKKEITFDWYVLQEGVNKIVITNTGQSELKFNYEFNRYGDYLILTHNIILITTAVIIIGFSAAFSVRKPKGF
ncbi:hypothetical protein QVH35_04990 [Candidatus Nitrosotenuis chungbukensis]|uniref:hypothetical protein n=1 Tax=Candidatus Nitrosotenuis chungbukensis TaxID=1353246 RepID=UPI0005B27589|nr:hypothetical protein [Candidatus Nitrosotenuis chungbukensis]WKT58711.1 hypothetical protein QVH35_04990 [Candidatus Nitrosotenuis chungbukensis]